MCRKVIHTIRGWSNNEITINDNTQALVTSNEVVPHEQGLDQLKDIIRRAKSNVEYDSANVMFVKEVPWMRQRREVS